MSAGQGAKGDLEDIPQTRWARTADGACIAYQDLGDGPVTLLVVHGWVSHLEVYWEQPRYARFMRRLSRNMRVLLFDKRGVGMSDRVAGTLDLGVLADDVRAVMDAAGVERAALLGWGSPGPQLAAFFAATHPERTLCLAHYGRFHYRKDADCGWGVTEEEFEADLAAVLASWGTDEGASDFIRQGYDAGPWTCPDDGLLGSDPYNEPEFAKWNAKLARYAATPSSCEAFERMWWATDVRPLLPSIATPTAVFYSALDPEDLEQSQAEAERIPGARMTGVSTPAAVIWLHEPEPIVSALERFIASVRHEEAALDRVLATVLFTDIVDSTQRAGELGDAGWKDLLAKHDQVARALLARYRGGEVKTMGDGFLATFDGPARAVKCAQAICEAVKPLGLEVRAGCHTGEIELLGAAGAEGADVGGIAVHIGARVAARAGPSEVLVSSTVKDLVAGSGLVFEDRGEHELKGVPDSWHLYGAGSADPGGR